MKVRMMALKNSISIIPSSDAYAFIRSVILAYCDNNCIPQDPLLEERVCGLSGKAGINSDGLPPHFNNEIELFLRDAKLNPEVVMEELKAIILQLEPDITIL